MTRPRFINRIDWSQLKKQKQVLLYISNTSKALTIGQKDDLIGIIHLIDAIQDYAVDSMGLSEEEVFELHIK